MFESDEFAAKTPNNNILLTLLRSVTSQEFDAVPPVLRRNVVGALANLASSDGDELHIVFHSTTLISGSETTCQAVFTPKVDQLVADTVASAIVDPQNALEDDVQHLGV